MQQLFRCQFIYTKLCHTSAHTHSCVVFEDTPPAVLTVHLAAVVWEWVQGLDVSLGAEPAGGSQRHAGCHLRISITSKKTEGSPALFSTAACHCTQLALMRWEISQGFSVCCVKTRLLAGSAAGEDFRSTVAYYTLHTVLLSNRWLRFYFNPVQYVIIEYICERVREHFCLCLAWAFVFNKQSMQVQKSLRTA